MTPERWSAIERLYHAALERHAHERDSFLRDVCKNDGALRREVESLLAHDGGAAFLSTPALALTYQTPTDSASLVGRRLGPYVISARLGEGGMGEVYRARDIKLGRDVAVKILPAAFVSDPDRLARFNREARMLASLNHPHIGAIYGLDETDGVPALVLELVEGETLAERIDRGPLPVKEALAIARQIADALETAHERGIVHRDLKPANVKITPDGTVKVLDFGLAKAMVGTDAPLAELTPSRTASVDTRDGIILGTAAYMSPEQARGKAVDKRTDVWAFGCMLYEMLTGRTAFPGETISDTLAAILEREPDWTLMSGTTAPTIRRLLRRCLMKDSKERLHDIADVRIEIDDLIGGETLDIPVTQRAARPRRDRLAWVGLAVVLLSLLALTASGRIGFVGSNDAPSFSRVVRLTSGPAREWAPAISPDGKWVAYLSNARGPTDVWVQFIAGGEAANVSAPAGLEVTPGTGIGGLDIAPDGAKIAVMARMRGSSGPFETWEIPAPLPGPARKLLADFVGLRWSSDGRRITFIRPGGSAGDALWVANTDGTNRHEIIALGGGRHIHWPTWSPDGAIYFIDTRTSLLNMEPSEISRIDPDGGMIEPVVATLRRAIFPLPMPDGHGLIYAANPGTAELSLWWRPPNGGPSHRLTAGIGRVHAEPRISADGRTLVCTLYDVHQSLIRVSVADNFGAATPITEGFTGDFDPSVSPSGDQLVFSSSRSGTRHLWTSAIDGSNARPLTSGDALDERPAVSPDGQQVAFISDRDGTRSIWLISADGGAPRKLANANVLGGMAWSRDGRELTFAGTDGSDWPSLRVLTVADGRIRRIPTTKSEAVGETASSPTADVIGYVAATTSGPSTARLAFVDSSGRPGYGNFVAPLSATPDGFAQNGILAWAPDGKRLAVVSQGTNTPSIWIVDPESARPYRKLIEFSGGPRLRGISWTPDGAAIIIGKHDVASSDIVMMTATR